MGDENNKLESLLSLFSAEDSLRAVMKVHGIEIRCYGEYVEGNSGSSKAFPSAGARLFSSSSNGAGRHVVDFESIGRSTLEDLMATNGGGE